MSVSGLSVGVGGDSILYSVLGFVVEIRGLLGVVFALPIFWKRGPQTPHKHEDPTFWFQGTRQGGNEALADSRLQPCSGNAGTVLTLTEASRK